MEEQLKGLYAALLVPFDENGQVKEEGLKQIAKNAIEVEQLDGLYVNGSSGENFLISKEQKKQIFKVVKEAVGNDVKLIAQVGSLDLNEAIELGKYATDLGYDALSAVTPFYYPFSFEEIKQYYFDIIEATQNKMIIYAIPDLTGVNISINQFKELFNNEKIVGVKYTAPNFFLLERIRKAFPDKLILSGFDEMLVQAVISGVDGAIGSTYNVNGRRARQIYDLAREGKIEEAYKIQHDTNNIIETVLSMGIYPTLKEILKTRGIDGGVPKRPFSPFNEANRKELNQLIETYSL
ncbi:MULTISPECIES: N-acetylneuraminate lyase [Staphylococcus]|mgnify:FL=1|uniref:N-acetylneuraminate lyase n=3 Tax=Bacillota TaxID=1239 RepID=A0A4Q9WR47_STAHO|nr:MULTISPECIES: N-acetylneuraminate lyase [Staphylococcus]EUZ67878.1 N-acetylneuraminate lyase [Staphylococcus sp. M0480]OFM60385.1 N-acetylneuraminate lyase [Staphylococcus sp. HMSC059G05]OFM77587.1 N-acetylneuraminate lyase [Staphylococcus sp. HMSC074B09]OFM92856.1 N-acetylneuraminate lyase [Staphylococcus sp. HMSC078D05]OFS50389.1 N-acetylneuraminate lyase [Staphylococcus sp. HMSC075H09]OHO56593.1 N-acetylneuraminate lyase [Staphylococcus sp. HMSC035F02]SKU48135.1 dihydrodipicolinate syn